MEAFPTRPTALHNLDEIVVFQGVADGYFGLCLEAADDVVEKDLSEGAAGEEDDVRSQGAGGSARSYVHQVFTDPDVEKGNRYRHYADEPHKKNACAEACRCAPEPGNMMSVIFHPEIVQS